MKNYGPLIAVALLATAFAGSAEAACAPGTFAYHKNGEDYCFSQSDGSNGGYRPKRRYNVTIAGHGAHGPHTNAGRAAELARLRARHLY
ncbi:exported protein of unknown function [Beijerinckiaceae bacterium RH AL1]|nr:hypothetical protein [Beijerinckiaceae bacterium]VVB48511.1 exported protein of unknown function [Beijerinckiaceae bacterium RH CH11]VVB48592.1 exported protein of unknown function [Beijerinckiaceae bacterium RH AL8]VVC56431.1 exported protein of unknown function [Beijerinckiaceae bacterium RH AL1]